MKELYMIMGFYGGMFNIYHIFETEEKVIDFFRTITKEEYYNQPDLWYLSIDENGKITGMYRMIPDDMVEILDKADREDLVF